MRDALWQALGVITMSFDLPLGFWPITLTLAVLAAWSMYRLFRLSRFTSWPTLAVIVGSALVFIGIPLYATAFWADHGVDTPATQELPSTVLGVLMWGYLAFVAVTVAMAKGYRLPLAGIAAFLVWMNCGVLLVAAMAVSGVWL
jgi:hypothetical protein